MKLRLLKGLFLVVCLVASAQFMPMQADAAGTLGLAEWDGATITVSGRGRVSARPDIAYINVGAEMRAETARDAQEAVARVVTRALAQLETLGAEKGEIHTLHVGVHPEWDREGDTPRVRGYRAVHDLRVTLRDLDAVGPWLDALIQQGLNRVSGVQFSVENGEQYQEEALRQAVANAARRAEVVSSAAGLGLGPVLDIEVGGASYVPFAGERMALASAAATTEVVPSQVHFEASVNVMYGLE